MERPGPNIRIPCEVSLVMLAVDSQAADEFAAPHSLNNRLQGLSGRLPGYALVLGTILKRRSMPAAYTQALAQEAGFGRMPVRIPGSRLPGFRRLGWVAILGVVLHVLLRQRNAGPQKSACRGADFSVLGLRDDARTLVALIRWVFSGLAARRTRVRSEAWHR